MKFRLLVLVPLLFILNSSVVIAQDFSNKGKDFWLAYPAHIDGNTSRMALYISATINTTGVVSLPGGATIPFTVTANQATVVQIFPIIYFRFPLNWLWEQEYFLMIVLVLMPK